MKIALIGYGRMGHAVEAVALEHGHEVIAHFDSSDDLIAGKAELRKADVAVEFTVPDAAVVNLMLCLDAGVPVVSGTTGWNSGDAYSRIVSYCEGKGGRMLWASNFSVGMNIMYAINERLAQLMSTRREYNPSIKEVHHIHKLDAPSGTAIVLQNQVRHFLPDAAVEITSVREGEVPGIHTVSYLSEADTISITHEAHGRIGLAQGALLAAKWLFDAEPGVYTMKDVLCL